MKTEEQRIIHNQKAVEYRKKKKAEDPEYYKKIWDKYRETWNNARNEKYHTDPDFKTRKDEVNKKYRSTVKGQKMLHNPKNMENARERKKQYYYKNIDIERKKYKEYVFNNREYILSLQKSRREELHDNYVGMILTRGLSIHWSKIHPDLIELKRQLIILRRTLKQLKNENLQRSDSNGY